MIKTQPLVSIIIPCYNTAAYVRETLESVYNQTYQNFEIIAIDDGSTDNTLEILHECAVTEPRLKVMSQENTYVVKARMNAIQQATGNYLVCLDSDDKLDETYLEKTINIAEKSPDIAVVYSNLYLFGKKNKIGQLKQITTEQLLLNHGMYISALIKKSAFDAVNGFDISLTHYEDWELFISIAKSGGEIKFIDEPLFYYRQREDESSICNTASEAKQSENFIKIYTKHHDFYQQNGIYAHRMIEALDKYKIQKIKYYNQPIRKWFYQVFKHSRWKKICQQYGIK
ncbi:glycosyltransferase family 2 protein [Neisseria sp. N95_16]|uniref:Glycosyltransferase n=1 Tax=Neisseria brasiliensis TaxID=2666100 RepID=A0A5Q3S4S9_9NEIS|nr:MULTISPECIES: glycosyltransferase [Neisseria]MRN38367.1 glycosyltransferase [Neisseria brasiliensis]PJO10158.1 glycosyltransferase family 2 protein [Neisseria sp. N95_16]PJO78629.1 glycosyltransferase family 2 protein [Neisseria sp. N177_16]QGL25366.1 glycosyltransferase [Neisseria brasiliensis]